MYIEDNYFLYLFNQLEYTLSFLPLVIIKHVFNRPQLCSSNASDKQSDNSGSILIVHGSLSNQTVHPFGVGKLVAISRQLGNHCRILQSVCSEWT